MPNSCRIKLVFLLLCLVFGHGDVFAQKRNILDSLGKLLKDKNLSKAEKSQILSLRAYYFNDIDSSLISAEKAISIAKEIDEPVLLADALEELSHAETISKSISLFKG